ncbi:protein phosphatase [Bacillus mesophilus]|uniref:Bis(5'-nucleosyl)-tetraphosphatase PrpE [asymmetrical] n=1 Tax=Bacillus mesophilus TaxID=1808955 RepID=A0A6M0Q2Q7_9BACI|nr:bis(5'-nucleosyl)-tetraphosphatase PrpE [Bacillus mesophilus]MBM7659734.1 protein phosphatase [Bacillus mesophilus]NEY70597.1 bis(5'-nucleosyl)-tetraphosphatase PrpE [Bacillus mesophilus]
MKVDIIGDIHGCYDEFFELTKKLDYEWQEGVPLHKEGRVLAFVGDLTDRGPKSIKVIQTIYQLVMIAKKGFYCPGNHCNKLYRFFLGRKVQTTHGLETTVAEWEALPKKEQEKVKNQFIELYEASPLYHVLDEKKLVIAHAGLRQDYIGRYDKKVQTFVLYGDITGESHPDGSPIRRDWAQNYTESAWVVYGHTPVKQARMINHTINIDTGAVFGGELTALRYPELETVSVPSSLPYVEEKFRSFS